MSCKNCNNCKINRHEKKEEHDEQEEKVSIIETILYIISVVLFMLTFIPSWNKWWMFLTIVILAGYKLIYMGIKNIFKLNFEEDTLMTIAMIAAFALGEFPESCMIILLYRLGEFLEDKAVDNSNKSIKNIVDIKSKTVNVINQQEKVEIIDAEKVQVGQIILIKPGELVPLDCKIIKGASNLDTANLTGETMPVSVKEDDSILSGSINLTGALTCRVEKTYENSTASQIVDLVYEAKNNKGQTEEFITKFSKIYTPVVVLFALFIALIPPIFMHEEFKTWIMRALVFLVASCPCSIVISVPLAFFSCIGVISKNGMIIKGSKHIENLATAKYIAFDKTGTITSGNMQVDNIVSRGNYTDDELLKYIYALETNSNHPISTAIKQKVEKDKLNSQYSVDKYEEIAGYGIKAIVKEIIFGNKKILEDNNIDEKVQNNASYIIIDKCLEGYVTFKEEIRENIVSTVRKLKATNIEEVIMLTGDNIENANKIADKVGIDKVYASLLPQDKLNIVKELKQNGKVIFVGDGINDSPVLAEADFGISMGEGTQIANSAADGILISNNITTIPKIIKIARKAISIVKFNITFSLLIKAIVIVLGTIGIAPVWMAVVADTGVSLLTVLNSIRIFKHK